MSASTLLAICLFAFGSIGLVSAATALKVGEPTKKTADAYGVLSAMGMANRWTFYIGKDGTIQSIDKNVKPATSAEDMAAKLHELGVATRGQ